MPHEKGFLCLCSSFRVLSATRWRRGVIAHPGVDHSSWCSKSSSTRQEEYDLFWNGWFPYAWNEENTNHDKNIAHGTAAVFISFAGWKFTFRAFVLYRANFTACKSRPYKESSSYEHSCWTRTDEIATSLRFSTTTGRERTVPGRALPHTLRFSSCRQEHTFDCHEVHRICPQAVRSWIGCLDFVLVPLPYY